MCLFEELLKRKIFSPVHVKGVSAGQEMPSGLPSNKMSGKGPDELLEAPGGAEIAFEL
ncbi:MAG: hypothetical protein IPM23_13525 [Candidatus Melainabacteria bacterium]|nr:hypothetical protein [Candidatus Melainabacteria bacterium]